MNGIEAFLVTTGSRYFAGQSGERRLALGAARGGRASFQIVVRGPSVPAPHGLDVSVASSDSAGEGVTTRVRRVGYVPLPHYNTQTEARELCDYGSAPTLAPDPLFDETATQIGLHETVVYWVRVDVDPEAKPGVVTLSCEVRATPPGVTESESAAELEVDLRIHPLTLEPREGLEVVHWFYADTLLDWYRYSTFDEGYWSMVPNYMANLRDHGVDSLYTPLFTAPTDGLRRPSQLIDIRRDGEGYRFDFRDVDRYLSLGAAQGFDRFEFPHLFTQWGAGSAIPLYLGQGADERPLLPPGTGSLDPGYRGFLEAFLPRLKEYLDSKHLTGRVRFHISDEPHGEEHRARYVAARALVREIAPWMKVMDAVSELSYGAEGLTDLPIPVIRAVGEYIARGIDCGTYYCCNPKGEFTNRFLDTPLSKIRALGWLLYRFRARISLFLHWGYNYWYRSQTRELIDPFTVTDGGRWPGWAYGDTFVVYPGPSGPIDSIRWEAFAEGLEDYRLLQSAGVDPEAAGLSPLRGFDDFPKRAGWYEAARAEAFAMSRGRKT